MRNDGPKTLEEAKVDVQAEIDGFGNGHSYYMVVGVDKGEFLNWAAERLMDPTFSELIGGLEFEEGRDGITVAKFDACEKYYPMLNSIIENAFPDAIVYGFGEWEDPMFDAPTDAYEVSLGECFSDDGNLRIDLTITDKKSGCTGNIGDLICFNSVESVRKAEDNDEYAYLTGMLNPTELETVMKCRSECEDYWRSEEAD